MLSCFVSKVGECEEVCMSVPLLRSILDEVLANRYSLLHRIPFHHAQSH